MTEILTLTDAELDLVAGGQVTGGAGGFAVAISAAVIVVGGNVDDSTLTATSGPAEATGGAGGAAED
jgi:hypothetical protein